MLGRSIILLLAGLCAALPAVAALPVPDAGGKEFETRYVAVGATVKLDGSGSYGKSCDLSYAWTLATKPAGSNASLANAGSVKPTFVPDRSGDYVFNLVVGEAGGTSDPASVTVSAISPSPYPLPAKNADRWMGLTNGLMDRTLAEITFPGTHDSGAYWLDVCDDEDCRGPDFAEPPPGERLVADKIENEVAHDVAQAHTQTLLQQLNGGIRYFDLRVTRRGGAFYVYHGLLGRPLATVLQDIRTFMEQSEQEFAVVDVSHLATGTNQGNAKVFTPDEHGLLMQQLVDQLGPYVYPRNGRSQAGLRATRLGQVVADGPKILLIYSDDYFYKCDEQQVCDFGPARDDPHFEQFWHQGFTTGGGYTNTVKMFDSMSCPRPVMPPGEPLPEPRGQFTDQKCKATLHAAGGDLTGFSLYQTLTANEDVVKASLCSKLWTCPDGLYPGPRTLRELSRTVNPYLPAMLEAILPVQPSVILVDFYEESAVVSEAIRLNQRDTEAPTSQATRHPPANLYGGSFEDVTVTMTAVDEQAGSGVAGIVYSLSGAQSAAPAEYCGAEAQVVVKAKGTTTVTYHAIDRAGNAGPARTLQVRADQQCDFNRDGRVDMADYGGLRRSLDDRRLWVVGDLNGDGQMSHQEWTSCLYKVLGRSR